MDEGGMMVGHLPQLFRFPEPTRLMDSLVQPLPDGPCDIVGDLHGDLEALESLRQHLGYDSEGRHPAQRSLVFVGDFTDRGQYSIEVVEWVSACISAGRASSVLGNHDLNLLLGNRKSDNDWFFNANRKLRNSILEFFLTLPLVLRRDDLRVVHACWQPEMVSMASDAHDVVEFFQLHRFNINLGIAKRSDLKAWQREMRLQNLNPVKVLTSGLEVQSNQSFIANGKKRILERYPWWQDYHDETICCFGHYSLPSEVSRNGSRAICVDFGNSKRWSRAGDKLDADFRLGAYRFPEHEIMFENGETRKLDLGEPRTRQRWA